MKFARTRNTHETQTLLTTRWLRTGNLPFHVHPTPLPTRTPPPSPFLSHQKYLPHFQGLSTFPSSLTPGDGKRRNRWNEVEIFFPVIFSPSMFINFLSQWATIHQWGDVILHTGRFLTKRCYCVIERAQGLRKRLCCANTCKFFIYHQNYTATRCRS